MSSSQDPFGGAVKAKFRDLAAAIQTVKTCTGRLFGIEIINNQAATAFVQLFDLLAANVTLGTTTPDKEFQVAANGHLELWCADPGVSFDTGIAIASTTTEKGSVGSAAGVQVFLSYR